MASPDDNSFTADTIALRLARLQAIESNHTQILSLLPRLHPSVASWLPQCYSQYRALVEDVSIGDGNTRSGTTAVQLAADTLRTELIYAKEFILSHYDEDHVRLDAFDIDGELVRANTEMLTLAGKIKNLTARHKTEGISYHINDVQIQRLNEAAEALAEAMSRRNESESDADTTHSEEHHRFIDDTSKLRRLLAAWHSEFGAHDPRIGLIGMVNTHRGGNSGRPGVPMLQVENNPLRLLLQADSSRPPATSYQVQFRDINESPEWVELHSGSETLIPLTDPHFGTGNGGVEIRARARNANGYSEWSAVLGGL